jgi:uncharacterized membrane protein YozB (DUF420 family)
MNNKLLKIVNPIMAIAFLTNQIAMLLYKIPGKLQYTEQMTSLHTWAGLVFLCLAICHIILNWRWIKTQIFGIKKK